MLDLQLRHLVRDDTGAKVRTDPAPEFSTYSRATRHLHDQQVPRMPIDCRRETD